MASFIVSQSMPERFRFHVSEAIEALGYYRIDALDQLLAMYRARWPKGTSPNMLSKGDIEPLLSAKGQAAPHHAQKATFLRAYFNLRRQQFDADQPQWSQVATELTFAARAQWLCDEARRQNGSKVRTSDRWDVPLPGCAQEWCPCRWDLVMPPF